MKANEIAWVSGWATDISIWENRIFELFPSYSHNFVNYSDLIEGDLRLAESEIVVGWSMGTLALLKNLNKKEKEQKWILVCPIADFCAEGCWSHVALRATRRGILQNTEQTLMSFSAFMGVLSKKEKIKWVESAMRYSPKQLIAGLDYLMREKAGFAELDSNIKLIFGEQDKIVPLAQKKLFSKADEQITVCKKSEHWLPDFFEEIACQIAPKATSDSV